MRWFQAYARPFVTQVEQGRIRDKEAAAQALAKQVASAQYAQVEAMVKADMQILKDKLPGKDDQAIENAKNLKYMKERQAILNLQSQQVVIIVLCEVVQAMVTFIMSFSKCFNFAFVKSRKGKDYVDQYLRDNCLLIVPGSDSIADEMPTILRFVESFRGVAGTVQPDISVS